MGSGDTRGRRDERAATRSRVLGRGCRVRSGQAGGGLVAEVLGRAFIPGVSSSSISLQEYLSPDFYQVNNLSKLSFNSFILYTTPFVGEECASRNFRTNYGLE